MPRSGAPFATAGAMCSLSSRDTFAEARVRATVAEEKAREETRSAEEAARLRQRWPTEFRDGARGAFLRRFDGQREPGAIRWASTAGRLSGATPGSPASTAASMTCCVS